MDQITESVIQQTQGRKDDRETQLQNMGVDDTRGSFACVQRCNCVQLYQCCGAFLKKKQRHTFTYTLELRIDPRVQEKKNTSKHYNFPSSKSMSIKILETDGSTYCEVAKYNMRSR